MRINVKILQSFWKKSKGLIGANPVYPVYFTTRWGIHTFGVLSPIDVIILDNKNRVVSLQNNLPPNRFYFWNPQFDRVIELPAGTIKKREINIGQTVEPTNCLHPHRRLHRRRSHPLKNLRNTLLTI